MPFILKLITSTATILSFIGFLNHPARADDTKEIPTFFLDRRDNTSFFNNGSDYTLNYDNKSIGTIKVYADPSNTYVRLERILPLLGITVRHDTSNNIVEIVLRDGLVIMMNINERTYTINNTKHDA